MEHKAEVDGQQLVSPTTHSNLKSNLFEKNPDKIFSKLHETKKCARNAIDLLQKQRKILDELKLEYYEFDTINTIHNKKTNHQELIYSEHTPLATLSINKIYRGKLKIWYHKTVSDHICLSETIPYEIINVAVKIIEQSDAVENENNEPEMLYYLHDQPDVIQLYGYHIDPIKKKCLLVLEWCAGNDLFSYMEENYLCAQPCRSIAKKEGRVIPISLHQIKYIIRWLIMTILECHNRDICHSDLKLDNIMFAIKNDITSLRLIDFGASKFIHDNGQDIIYKSMVISPHYIPPEVINRFFLPLNCPFLGKYILGGENLLKIDIWQIGVLAYILVNGHFPFDSAKRNHIERNEHIFKIVGACRPLIFTKNRDINNVPLCNDQCIDFINKLMAYNPHDRMTLTDALNHPWLKQ
jgi:serine/threonine protein kinase